MFPPAERDPRNEITNPLKQYTMKTKTKKIELTKNADSKWSYKDDEFWKDNMNLLEVTSMYIARLAATLQVIDDKNEDAKIKIVVTKS